jgi:hypothetical protein
MTNGFVGYKMGSLIRGWKIESADPVVAGCLLLEKFSKHSLAEIQDFFLHNISLEPKAPQPLSIEMLYEQNWVPGQPLVIHVKDESAFLRDPILCEFGYVFDLTGPKKLLRLFKGLGTEPSKGYEKYNWTDENGKVHYINEVAILAENPYDKNYIRLLAYMYQVPNLVGCLFNHTAMAIRKNPEKWVKARNPNLSASELLFIVMAVKNYINGALVTPSGETVEEFNLIERPRRVLWR